MLGKLPLAKTILGSWTFVVLPAPLVLLSAASFLFTLFATPLLLKVLGAAELTTAIRPEAPERHRAKAGTPALGGLSFVASAGLLTLLFNLVHHYSQLLSLGALAAFAVLGMFDDVLGSQRYRNFGLKPSAKLLWSGVIAALIVAGLHVPGLLSEPDSMWIPFAGRVTVGWTYWLFALLAVVGTAHAANLTDGLDGLAGGTGAIAFAAFGVIALIGTQLYTAEFCFTMVGGLVAFLRFNMHPARIFMGDTGSLAVGGSLATVALLQNQLLLLPVVGFPFVAVTLSVIAQVATVKLASGRRLFLMAPLHHHFELLGWTEPAITRMFWCAATVSGLAGLALALSLRLPPG